MFIIVNGYKPETEATNPGFAFDEAKKRKMMILASEVTAAVEGDGFTVIFRKSEAQPMLRSTIVVRQKIDYIKPKIDAIYGYGVAKPPRKSRKK